MMTLWNIIMLPIGTFSKKTQHKKKQMIKKIHQIWVQGQDHLKEYDPRLFAYTQKFKELFPDFEHHIWSESEYLPFIASHSKALLHAYTVAPQFAGKADIARFVLLWEFGGLYVDTDYEPFRNCSFLLNDTDLVIVAMHLPLDKKAWSQFEFNTAWIYAKPHHPLCGKMIERVEQNPFDLSKKSEYDYIWQTGGPNGFASVISEMGATSDPRTRVIVHQMIELMDFANLSMIDKSAEDLSTSYPFAMGIHRINGSWMPGIQTIERICGGFYTWWNNSSDFIGIAFCILLILYTIIIIVLSVKLVQANRRLTVQSHI